MAVRTIKVIMNGVTGRMGYRQHLVRSILADPGPGRCRARDGTRIQVEPILVGRNEESSPRSPSRHGVAAWTTDLDAASPTRRRRSTSTRRSPRERTKAILAAIDGRQARLHREADRRDARRGARARPPRSDAGVITGVVHDKLYLPGLVKLKRLVDAGFFGRILSVRGEFGYWVFEGDRQPAQRPSWNYRAEDGGGITIDMFRHWNYVLENLFGRVEAVTAKAVTHIPERWDEQGNPYDATADDAAYGIFELEGGVIAQINSSWAVRVYRDELVEFQVDGTHGSAVAGLLDCRSSPRAHTPKPVWNPDLPADRGLPRPVARGARQRRPRQRLQGAVGGVPARRRRRPPAPLRPVAGVRGVQLAEAGLQSSARGPPRRDPGDPAVTPRRGATHAARRPTAAGATSRCGEPRRGRSPAAARAPGSPSRPPTSSPTRSPTTRPARPPASTGTPRSRSGAPVSVRPRASPRRWTPPSAAWAWTGRPPRS